MTEHDLADGNTPAEVDHSRDKRLPSVCLTFDFDAFSLWMSRNMTSPGPLSRGEFGAHAVPRILRLLAERDVVSTWFIPGHTAVTYPDLCKQIVGAGHEVALHGWNHEPVSALTGPEEKQMLARAYECLERVTGIAPTGNRTPAWDYTSDTVASLLDLGLTYDSSLMATDYAPYFTRRGDVCLPDVPYQFGASTRLVQLPVSWTLDDYPIFEYFRTPQYVMPGMRSPRDVFANFLDDVRYMIREEPRGVCVITFHPQVIGRGHRMLGLERFIEELLDLPVRTSRCDMVAQDFLSAAS
jgi:peptidoglycan/xylan/chitin deacetylase (PgdA/CDA1 family)